MSYQLTPTERKNRSLLKTNLLLSPLKYGFKEIPTDLQIKLFLENNISMWCPKNDFQATRILGLQQARAEIRNKLLYKFKLLSVKVDKKTITIPQVNKSLAASKQSTSRRSRKQIQEYTGYKSNLTPDEWIKKYISRFSWDREYLKKYRNIDYSLVAKNKLQILKLMPRKTGKSVSDVGIYAWHLAENNFKIGVGFPGRGMLNKVWYSVLAVLRSPAVIKDYGQIIAWTDKTKGIIETIAHEQSTNDAGLDFACQMFTRGAEIIGSHFDIAYYHDIIQEEFQAEESNEALVIWFDNVMNYITKNHVTSGTRKSPEDFYNHLKKKGHTTIHEKAIHLITGRYPDISDITFEIVTDENGDQTKVPIDIDITCGTYQMLDCPDFTLKELLIDRAINLEAFETNMQNLPISETGNIFKRENWIEVDLPPLTDFKVFDIAVDTAYGTSDKADNTCIIVTSWKDGDLYLLDGYYGYLDYTDIGIYSLDYFTKYDNPGKNQIVRTMYFHKDFAEVWLMSNQYLQRIPRFTPIDNKINKMVRIKALSPLYRKRIIKCNRNLPFRNEAFREYVQFDGKPSTSTKKDDFLDALSTIATQTGALRLSQDKYKSKAWEWQTSK